MVDEISNACSYSRISLLLSEQSGILRATSSPHLSLGSRVPAAVQNALWLAGQSTARSGRVLPAEGSVTDRVGRYRSLGYGYVDEGKKGFGGVEVLRYL
mmetsp:Transcript_14144/g.30699  ORF Transcript_14144/g.30699 Transcript_14144/m.30699 type:complete len:99 (-) Transcript_14144:837-1133(-)